MISLNNRSVWLFALATAFLPLPATAQDEPDLSAQTIEDINDGLAILRAHHPGMHDPQDPAFAARLEEAGLRALAAAEDVETAEDRVLAISVVNNTLADSHAFIVVPFNGTRADWPGFEAVWRGESLIVSTPSEAGPPVGSRLLSCDGRAAIDLIEEDMLRSEARPQEAGEWWTRADGFLTRVALSVSPDPENCVFQLPDSTMRAFPMRWGPIPPEVWQGRFTANRPEPLGLMQPSEGVHWIALPTFSPGPDDIAIYNDIFDTLAASEADLAGARAIVLDLRGNNGGSSLWSRRLAELLWGEEAVDWALADYFRDTEIWNFADAANLAHAEETAARLREQDDPGISEAFEELAIGLRQAMADGAQFYIEDFGEELLAHATPTEPRALPPVYVITDGGCVSACLDAVDVFTRFEGVTLVGAPTSADTNYLQARWQRLPSGRGRVRLPTKIWVNRPRGSGEVYHPDILVTDLDWSTTTFLRHIEADLAAR